MKLPPLTPARGLLWTTDTSHLERLIQRYNQKPFDVLLCQQLVAEAKRIYPTDVPLKEYARILGGAVKFIREPTKRDAFRKFRDTIYGKCTARLLEPVLGTKFPPEITVDILSKYQEPNAKTFLESYQRFQDELALGRPQSRSTLEAKRRYQHELLLWTKYFSIKPTILTPAGEEWLRTLAEWPDILRDDFVRDIVFDADERLGKLKFPNKKVDLNALRVHLERLYPYRKLILLLGREWTPNSKEQKIILRKFPELHNNIDNMYESGHLTEYFGATLPEDVQKDFRAVTRVFPYFTGDEWYYYISNYDNLKRAYEFHQLVDKKLE